MVKSIAEEAKKVREKYGLIGTAIDPTIIAKENDIKIVEKSNLKLKGELVSGAIIKDESDIMIILNAEDSKNRKRFTIAHELAHYFLHLDKNVKFVDYKRSDSSDPKELDADEFAGCLLMGEELVKEKFKKAKSIGLDNDGIVNVLSGIFVVSNSAMYTRLKRLELL
ncbi:ImmA/IrrE family metallo-endopeptidase [Clostridium beijerinckii]|nr:ImmA/IrrE family metallo-endopeptidase [Clostridium beijerinckii]NRY59831.1 Zn-dependent peptidase ImmA (M78 family) [Clostridium beijerinckii]